MGYEIGISVKEMHLLFLCDCVESNRNQDTTNLPFRLHFGLKASFGQCRFGTSTSLWSGKQCSRSWAEGVVPLVHAEVVD